MSDLATFEKDLDQFEEAVGIEHSNACAAAAILLFALIVSRTPYDTGQTRSSWQIAIGSPNPAVNVKGKYPQYADPSTAFRIAQAEATAKLANYKFGLTGFRPAIWITNKLRHVSFLEKGTSKTKAHHMVSLSVEEVRARFSEIATQVEKGRTVGTFGVSVN